MATLSLAQALRLLPAFLPRRERFRLVLVLVMAVVMAVVELIIAGLVAVMAAAFSSPEAVMQLWPVKWLAEFSGFSFFQDPRLLVVALLGAIVASVFLKNALTVLQQWHITALSEGTSCRIQKHLLKFYLRVPFLWIVQCGTPSLLFQMSLGSHLAMLQSNALLITSNLLMMITMLGGLLVASFMPSLLFFICIGLGGTIIVFVTRSYMDKLASKQHNVLYTLNFLQQTGIHALKEMRMYRRETFLSAKLADLLDRVIVLRKKQQAFTRVPVGLLELWGFFTLCAVLLFLVFIQDASMERITGIMGFLAAAAWRSLPVANRLVDQLTVMRMSLPYIHTLAETLRQEKEFAPELSLDFSAASSPVSFKSQIRFENVSFWYPNSTRPSLDAVNMEIKAGEITGIVGLSGAGKSTLVNLLTGLFPPSSGRISVDGVGLDKQTIPSWLQKIGYVTQAPFLLDASLAENIAFSRWGESIDRDRVLECCRMAALDFLDQLENGIDTIIGERGMRLSGGQAQRVAIARALYSDPEMIIFDEATSSLDIKNEKAIRDTIMSLRRKATMVIIAHRLSTVEGCDSIVWLDKGVIVEKGAATAVLEHYKHALHDSDNEI